MTFRGRLRAAPFTFITKGDFAMTKKQHAVGSIMYLLESAELVVARWERGDLAGAVRQLDNAIDTVKAAIKAASK